MKTVSILTNVSKIVVEKPSIVLIQMVSEQAKCCLCVSTCITNKI